MFRILTLAFVLFALHSKSQTVRDILQRHWVSRAVLEGDSVICHLYSIKINDDNTYTGFSSTTFIKGGKRYSAISAISGKLKIKRKDVFLTYKDIKPVQEDPIPRSRGGWCREEGFLYLLEDAERPGQYFIKARVGCPDGDLEERIYY